MTAERWQQVEAIVQSALDIESSAERDRFVSSACAGDEQLQNEVERLIAATDDADSFIESPAWTESILRDSFVRKNILDSFDEYVKHDGDLYEQAG
jgi:hypothetical protein